AALSSLSPTVSGCHCPPRCSAPLSPPPRFLPPPCFFSSHTSTPHTHTLSLHDALPIFHQRRRPFSVPTSRTSIGRHMRHWGRHRSEEHTSELQSPDHLVCRLLLEKKKQARRRNRYRTDWRGPHTIEWVLPLRKRWYARP